MAAVTLAAVAALLDRARGRVPNLLTGPALLIGVLLGGGWAIAAAVLCGAWLLQLDGISVGGGDVKLLAAVAALHPLLGIALTLSVPRIASGRISMRAGPELAVWAAIFAVCMELR